MMEQQSIPRNESITLNKQFFLWMMEYVRLRTKRAALSKYIWRDVQKSRRSKKDFDLWIGLPDYTC